MVTISESHGSSSELSLNKFCSSGRSKSDHAQENKESPEPLGTKRRKIFGDQLISILLPVEGMFSFFSATRFCLWPCRPESRTFALVVSFFYISFVFFSGSTNDKQKPRDLFSFIVICQSLAFVAFLGSVFRCVFVFSPRKEEETLS